MEGICYSICPLYKAMLDWCKKNYYCKIALYDFVSDTALEMLTDFYAWWWYILRSMEMEFCFNKPEKKKTHF